MAERTLKTSSSTPSETETVGEIGNFRGPLRIPPGQSEIHGMSDKGRARWAIRGLLLALVAVIYLYLFVRVLWRVGDEGILVYGAQLVTEGAIPYRDFFEHHTPWTYFGLAPFFRWFAVDQSFDSAKHFLIFARGLSLVLTALSAVLVFLIGRLGANRTVGLLAALSAKRHGPPGTRVTLVDSWLIGRTGHTAFSNAWTIVALPGDDIVAARAAGSRCGCSFTTPPGRRSARG